MTFIPKPPKPKAGEDCKDFKPKFWERKFCKHSHKCGDTDNFLTTFDGLCTGTKYSREIGERPIKPERMDHIEKGARIGRPRNGGRIRG